MKRVTLEGLVKDLKATNCRCIPDDMCSMCRAPAEFFQQEVLVIVTYDKKGKLVESSILLEWTTNWFDRCFNHLLVGE